MYQRNRDLYLAPQHQLGRPVEPSGFLHIFLRCFWLSSVRAVYFNLRSLAIHTSRRFLRLGSGSALNCLPYPDSHSGMRIRIQGRRSVNQKNKFRIRFQILARSGSVWILGWIWVRIELMRILNTGACRYSRIRWAPGSRIFCSLFQNFLARSPLIWLVSEIVMHGCTASSFLASGV